MKERFQILNGKAVVRAFWQIAAIALFTTAASSGAFAGDAQSRLPASQAASPATSQEASQAAKKNLEIPKTPVEAIGSCRVTNISFSKQESDYSGTVNIKVKTENGGPFRVLATLHGDMGQFACGGAGMLTNFSVGANDVNASPSCNPTGYKADYIWKDFSITLWQSGTNIGHKCYPQKMPIKGVMSEGMSGNPRAYKK